MSGQATIKRPGKQCDDCDGECCDISTCPDCGWWKGRIDWDHLCDRHRQHESYNCGKHCCVKCGGTGRLP